MENSNAGHGVRGGHVPYGDRYGYPSMGETVSHYYGDLVRQFFLGGAVVMLFAAPFYADDIRAEFPFVVVAAIIFVGLAAVTNPWKRSIITADAIAAGVVSAVYQMWALNGYGDGSATAFVLREAISVISLFAFYFSVKTVRAMVLHQIGKRAMLDEFAGGTSNNNSADAGTDTDESPISQMRHAFDDEPIDDDDETPPHKPTFWEKTG